MNPAPCVPIGGRDFRRVVTTAASVRYYWGVSLCLVWWPAVGSWSSRQPCRWQQ